MDRSTVVMSSVKVIAFLLTLLIFCPSLSGSAANTIEIQEIQKLLNSVEIKLRSRVDYPWWIYKLLPLSYIKKINDVSDIVDKDFIWWNIHYTYSPHSKETILKWSNFTPEPPNIETLYNIFYKTSLSAPIKLLTSQPTLTNYKHSCLIDNKWRNKWLVWNGNYQIEELNKLGEPLYMNKEDSSYLKTVRKGDASLLYFSTTGEDIIVTIIKTATSLKIIYASYRLECDV